MGIVRHGRLNKILFSSAILVLLFLFPSWAAPSSSRTTSISIDVVDAETRSILRGIAEAAHLDLSMDESVTGKITVRLHDSTPEEAIRVVCETAGLYHMDGKGAYIIRQLFEAYLTNPRQMPDWSLDKYCEIKARDLQEYGKDHFENWISEISREYGIMLRKEEKETLFTFLLSNPSERHFRRVPSWLIDKLIPFMAADSDYFRIIADRVSLMTDSYAQDEYEKLY